MAEHGGELQTARMLWTATYQTTHDDNVKANAASHLRAITVDDEVTQLERLIGIYRQRTGRTPSSFEEMAAVGLLRGTPADPLGNPFRLAPGGNVEVTDPDDLPFIEKGLPEGYVPSAAPKILPADR
jgi:hypothetical protein